jgi:hypothetical protein
MQLPVAEWNGWKLAQIFNWVVASKHGEKSKWFFKPEPEHVRMRYHSQSVSLHRWLDENLPRRGA